MYVSLWFLLFLICLVPSIAAGIVLCRFRQNRPRFLALLLLLSFGSLTILTANQLHLRLTVKGQEVIVRVTEAHPRVMLINNQQYHSTNFRCQEFPTETFSCSGAYAWTPGTEVRMRIFKDGEQILGYDVLGKN